MTSSSKEIQIGPQGRLVVPAKLRRELGMESGCRLLIRVEDGSLILEPRKVVERRLHERGTGSGRIRRGMRCENCWAGQCSVPFKRSGSRSMPPVCAHWPTQCPWPDRKPGWSCAGPGMLSAI